MKCSSASKLENCDLADLDRVPDGWFHKLLISSDFHTQQSLGVRQKGTVGVRSEAAGVINQKVRSRAPGQPCSHG